MLDVMVLGCVQMFLFFLDLEIFVLFYCSKLFDTGEQEVYLEFLGLFTLSQRRLTGKL